jgi:hypothetical protein
LLNTNTVYYWRVQAANSNGVSTSGWSAVFNFKTIDGPEPNSVSGTITFADNQFMVFPSYYTAGAFNVNIWPPQSPEPLSYDSLTIQLSGSTYFANYKVGGLPNGSYYISTASYSSGSFTGILHGLYGCDTNRAEFSSCPFTPQKVTISGNNGVTNINFLSWADSTKSIF